MKPVVLGLCLVLAEVLRAPGPVQAAFTRTEDVIYARKFGAALTLDVFRPTGPNGYGIVMPVSGAWFSSHEAINPALFTPLLDRGYTVFAVVHGSVPQFTVSQIVPDIHRAIRFIRHNAAVYGINPDKIGMTGISSGCHLALMMAVQGAPEPGDAEDPVDRESSAVQGVACFFPPTDFLNYGRPGEDGVGVGRLSSLKPAFGSRSDTPAGRQALGREISPIEFVSSNTPPIFLAHGDADVLVPLSQSQQFLERCREAGVETRLLVREGKAHGWPDMVKDQELFAEWFDHHLRGLATKP